MDGDGSDVVKDDGADAAQVSEMAGKMACEGSIPQARPDVGNLLADETEVMAELTAAEEAVCRLPDGKGTDAWAAAAALRNPDQITVGDVRNLHVMELQNEVLQSILDIQPHTRVECLRRAKLLYDVLAKMDRKPDSP